MKSARCDKTAKKTGAPRLSLSEYDYMVVMFLVCWAICWLWCVIFSVPHVYLRQLWHPGSKTMMTSIRYSMQSSLVGAVFPAVCMAAACIKPRLRWLIYVYVALMVVLTLVIMFISQLPEGVPAWQILAYYVFNLLSQVVMPLGAYWMVKRLACTWFAHMR